MPLLEVAIIGGGPSGLATAIACKQRNLSYILFEKGSLVNSICRFPVNMVFFTTPELLEIGDLPLVTQQEKPSRLEALKYYRKATEHYRLETRLYEKVETVSRIDDGFELKPSFQKNQVGEPTPVSARNLVLAMGYYDHPNLLGIPGEELDKVSHYYTEAHPYFGLNVVVIGGSNGAAETALDLFRSGVKVTLIHRGKDLSKQIKYWVRPDILNRIKNGEVTAYLNTCVEEILPDRLRLKKKSGKRFEIANDAVLAMTGYRPDYRFLESLGIEIEKETGKPHIDPETCESNVPGIYLAGGISAGRMANTIFIENGRFHGEKIICHIAKKSY